MNDSAPSAFRVASKFGRYTILERLGAGGMGEVWTAYDPHLDRKIALKLIHSQFEGARQDKYRARLLREAQALAKLSHPHVVTVYDVDRIDDRLYIAMEFIEGETVTAWVERVSPSWKDILEVYMAAARGLAAAHQQGIVHRDIKPSNIVVGTDKRVCVLDFGLAKALQGDATIGESTLELEDETSLHDVVLSARQSLTKTGPTIGTPGYMALEQIRGGRHVGPAADQFSLAVSLYESLYGHSPFSRASLLARLTAMEAGDVVPPPSDTVVPSQVFEVLCRALRPNPDERYPSMEALIHALEHPERLSTRRRHLWLGAVGAALVAGAGAIWLARVETDPPPAPCQGAAEIWSSVWNDSRRTAVEEAILATGVRYGNGVSTNVFTAADRFGKAWKASWTHVCEATAVQEVQSQALLEARMDCLTASRHKMDAVIAIFEDADEAVLDRSVNLLESVDEPAGCETLKPPSGETETLTPMVRKALDVARQRLAQSDVAAEADRHEDALKMAKEAKAIAQRHGRRSLLAQALLAEGNAVFNRERADAIENYQEAIEQASRAGDLRTELRAWEQMSCVSTVSAQDRAKQDAWVGAAKGALARAERAGIAQPEDELRISTCQVASWIANSEFERAKAQAEILLDGVDPDTTMAIKVWDQLGLAGHYTGDAFACRRSLYKRS